MFKGEVKSRIGEDISILVKADNHAWNYICECGDASDLTVKEVQNTNAVFISHTHIDHFVNFDAMIRHQIGIQRRVVIVGPLGIAKQVQAKINAYTWNLIKEGAITYEIREVESPGIYSVYELEPPKWELIKIKTVESEFVFEEKTFAVTCAILDHKIPSLAYKFKENDTVKIDLKNCEFRGGPWVAQLKSAYENKQDDQVIEIDGNQHVAKYLYHLMHVQTGDSLGVIMDHAANEANHALIRETFNECRQVFIESFFKDEDKEQAIVNLHSYASMSGKVMREAKVKEPVPVHFSRKYDEKQIQELIHEFETALKA